MAAEQAAKRPTITTKMAKIGDEEDSRGSSTNHKDGDENAQLALEKIVGIQHEIDSLNEQASEEILHVEQKYNQLRKPHYQKRAKLAQEIPEFWFTTLTNHPAISQLLNEEDEQALIYLENLTVDEFEDVKSGYKISMHFRPNPYFENAVLLKELTLDVSGDSTITGTDIKWKPNRDLTKLSDIEFKGRKRTLEEVPSFFCWFSDTNGNESDEIAETIKDEIWPNPLQFFLHGEVSVDEGEEEEDDEDEEAEGDIEGEEDDEDPDPDELVDLEEDEDDDDEGPDDL